jgi:predicted MFS family arabinose efflux permease
VYLAGYFLFGFGYIVIITYAVAALRDDGGFSAGHAANDYALLGVGTVFGGLVLGRLSDRTSRRLAMGLGYGLSGLCPLLLLTAQEPLVGAAALVFGALFSGSVVVVAAYLADHVAPAEFGAAFGTATVAFGAAQALGPQVGGSLADHTGSFTLTFVVGSAALLAAALTTPALAGRRR